MIYLLVSVFLLLSTWAYLSWRQQKNYLEALRRLYSNKNLLGMGQRKSWHHPGLNAILILALNKDNHKICGCQKFTGMKIWQPFEEIRSYNNYSLDELRELAIWENTGFSNQLKNRYWQHKGVLLQAVEDLESRLLKQKIDVINQMRLKKIEASIAGGALVDDAIIDNDLKEEDDECFS
ncbi:transcriptional regulator GutM [Eubacteriaceae bacterium ES2]|nr:transcriptional regulator GutM [Eubacteriaceae bacterium ES2]